MSILTRMKCRVGRHEWGEWKHVPLRGRVLDSLCQKKRTCLHCEASETRSSEPHAWAAWSYPAQGACDQERVCSRCQSTEVRDVVHEWKDRSNVCKNERVCERCGKVDTKAATHEWGEWSLKPSGCEQVRACGKCQERETKKGEHDWGKWSRQPADAKPRRVCARCGASEEDSILGQCSNCRRDILGHEYQNSLVSGMALSIARQTHGPLVDRAMPQMVKALGVVLECTVCHSFLCPECAANAATLQHCFGRFEAPKLGLGGL